MRKTFASLPFSQSQLERVGHLIAITKIYILLTCMTQYGSGLNLRISSCRCTQNPNVGV